MKYNIKQLLILLKKTFLEVYINDSLELRGFDILDEKTILINTRNQNLYAIELISTSNEPKTLNKELIDNIYSNYQAEDLAQLYIFFLKEKTSQRILIFSKNKDILEYINQHLTSKFLFSLEILNAIYDIMLNNYYLEENELEKNVDFRKYNKKDNLKNNFNRITKEAMINNIKSVDIYQAHRYKDKTNNEQLNISKIFNNEWEGVLFTYIDFNYKRIETNLKKMITNNKLEDNYKDFLKLEDNFKDKHINLIMLNTAIIIKKQNNSRRVIEQIGTNLKIDFVKKELFKRELLQKTFLLKQDSYYDAILPLEWINNFIGTNIKEIIFNADIKGITSSNNIFTFSFDKINNNIKTTNQMTTIIGASGSGKTTTVNGLLSQILKFDIKNYKADISNNKLRFFDIKKSGKDFYSTLKKTNIKNDMEYIETNFNELRFNPISIKCINNKIDENELEISIYIINTILVSKDKNIGLTLQEQNLCKEIIRELYHNKEHHQEYIFSLKENYKKIYQEIINLGYDENQTIDEIKEEEFLFLKEPKLLDIKKSLNQVQHTADDKKKEVVLSLKLKLETISGMSIFSSNIPTFNKEDIKKYIHIDFDKVKDNIPNYTIVFIAFFMSLYKKDKEEQENIVEEQEKDKITYIFEEAYNVLSNNHFIELIKKFTNEARSYNIRIIFASQLEEHIPSQILEQVEHKIYLLPQADKKIELINRLSKKYNIKEETKNFLINEPPYSIILFNSGGISSFKLNLTKEEINIYGQ